MNHLFIVTTSHVHSVPVINDFLDFVSKMREIKEYNTSKKLLYC